MELIPCGDMTTVSLPSADVKSECDDVTSLMPAEADESCVAGAEVENNLSPIDTSTDGDAMTSVAAETAMDSADIIPEAAMKCGILPLDSLILSDNEAYRMLCSRDEFRFNG